MKNYVTSDEPRYYYPGAGDPQPPGGAKVLLLTRGGVCVTGVWLCNGSYLAWSPMPRRDRARESAMAERADFVSLTDGDCEA